MICAYCGAPFESSRPHARYCCPEHRQAQYDQRRKKQKRMNAVE